MNFFQLVGHFLKELAKRRPWESQRNQQKTLWAAAGGRCSYSNCGEKLFGNGSPSGNMAHICAENAGGNRYDPNQSDVERHDYANLILLCPNHHTLIDKRENEHTYTVELLHEMKRAHESKLLEIYDNYSRPTKIQISKDVLIMLQDNHKSWETYGPESQIARLEPHNERIYNLWMMERLSVIVPNNRKISLILEKHRRLFDPNEQEAISSFLIHARSYESWVQDEIRHVVQFPMEFESMIRGVINISHD